MPHAERYVRRPDQPVVAIQIALETEGLTYRKWGGEQRARARDWLVDNMGDVYTVAADVFARTYRQTGLGTYVKSTPVWAERARSAGSVTTREGVTHYDAGDYIVSNRQDGSDRYAISADKFESMYVREDEI